jgi:hypothetical protein
MPRQGRPADMRDRGLTLGEIARMSGMPEEMR